jgi:chaperone required for assembly of F1-ATPase
VADDLPRRFYERAGVEERDGAFVLVLDGKQARTPARAPLAVPSRALGEAMAEEWNAQGPRIDPRSMPLTRIVNVAIDGVARHRREVIAEIVKYAGSDMVCYRAEEPAELVERQREAWDPLLAWADEALGCPLNQATGILFADQPKASLDAVFSEVSKYDNFGLAALSVITTLTGSAILALAVAKARLEPESAWAAAYLDENYQNERWGIDEEAQEKRAARWREMDGAARLLTLHPARLAANSSIQDESS